MVKDKALICYLGTGNCLVVHHECRNKQHALDYLRDTAETRKHSSLNGVRFFILDALVEGQE